MTGPLVSEVTAQPTEPHNPVRFVWFEQHFPKC